MEKNRLHNLHKELPIRIDKTLAWLANSRDQWREKCKETKLQLKRQTLAVKRLRASRNDWKLQNIMLKQELINSKQKMSSLQHRVEELESQIEKCKNEALIVKKKR